MKKLIVSVVMFVVAFAATVSAQTPSATSTAAPKQEVPGLKQEVPVLEKYVVTPKGGTLLIEPPQNIDKIKTRSIIVSDGCVKYEIEVSRIIQVEYVTNGSGSPLGFDVTYSHADGLNWTKLHYDNRQSYAARIVQGDYSLESLQWLDFFWKAVPARVMIEPTAGKGYVLESNAAGAETIFEFLGNDKSGDIIIREVDTKTIRVYNQREFAVAPTDRAQFRLGKFDGRLWPIITAQSPERAGIFVAIEVPLEKKTK